MFPLSSVRQVAILYAGSEWRLIFVEGSREHDTRIPGTPLVAQGFHHVVNRVRAKSDRIVPRLQTIRSNSIQNRLPVLCADRRLRLTLRWRR
jgi:hypothetical protein